MREDSAHATSHRTFLPASQSRPEKVRFRFLSLLQSDFFQPFSARSAAAFKRRFRRLLRAYLDTAQAERGREPLSGGRLLSEAWDLADPVYKVGPQENWLLPRWVTASGVAANPGRSTADERVAALSV